MWKAYYRRQPARLFGLLIRGLREQAHASWPRALVGQPVADEGRRRVRAGSTATTSDSRPTSPAATGSSGCPRRRCRRRSLGAELRWWVVRREIGLAAGTAAGEAITRLYAAIYGSRAASPRPAVCAARRPRSAIGERPADPDGLDGAGTSVLAGGRRVCCGASYRSLRGPPNAVDEPASARPDGGR